MRLELRKPRLGTDRPGVLNVDFGIGISDFGFDGVPSGVAYNPKSEIRYPKSLRDHLAPRDWRRPWRDPPGFLLPNCPCCSGGGAPAQNYYVFGGTTLGTPSARQAINYQWSSGWTAKAGLSSARDSMAASTPTTTSSAYTYGGVSNAAFLTQSDSYSPDTWSTNTPMSSPSRYRSSGVAISSLGYCWGGWNSSNTTQSRNEQMTPGSPSTWTTKTPMTAARSNSVAAPISGKGYLICGADSSNANVATNYEYSPSGDSWATKTACPAPAKNGLAGFSISGVAYVTYGAPDATRRNDGYVVDVWSSNATAPGALTQYPASGSIDLSGVGWATGGTNNGATSLAQHSEYVPNAWASRTGIPTPITNAVASPA